MPIHHFLSFFRIRDLGSPSRRGKSKGKRKGKRVVGRGRSKRAANGRRRGKLKAKSRGEGYGSEVEALLNETTRLVKTTEISVVRRELDPQVRQDLLEKIRCRAAEIGIGISKYEPIVIEGTVRKSELFHESEKTLNAPEPDADIDVEVEPVSAPSSVAVPAPNASAGVHAGTVSISNPAFVPRLSAPSLGNGGDLVVFDSSDEDDTANQIPNPPQSKTKAPVRQRPTGTFARPMAYNSRRKRSGPISKSTVGLYYDDTQGRNKRYELLDRLKRQSVQKAVQRYEEERRLTEDYERTVTAEANEEDKSEGLDNTAELDDLNAEEDGDGMNGETQILSDQEMPSANSPETADVCEDENDDANEDDGRKELEKAQAHRGRRLQRMKDVSRRRKKALKSGLFDDEAEEDGNSNPSGSDGEADGDVMLSGLIDDTAMAPADVSRTARLHRKLMDEQENKEIRE